MRDPEGGKGEGRVSSKTFVRSTRGPVHDLSGVTVPYPTPVLGRFGEGVWEGEDRIFLGSPVTSPTRVDTLGCGCRRSWLRSLVVPAE